MNSRGMYLFHCTLNLGLGSVCVLRSGVPFWVRVLGVALVFFAGCHLMMWVMKGRREGRS